MNNNSPKPEIKAQVNEKLAGSASKDHWLTDTHINDLLDGVHNPEERASLRRYIELNAQMLDRLDYPTFDKRHMLEGVVRSKIAEVNITRGPGSVHERGGFNADNAIFEDGVQVSGTSFEPAGMNIIEGGKVHVPSEDQVGTGALKTSGVQRILEGSDEHGRLKRDAGRQDPDKVRKIQERLSKRGDHQVFAVPVVGKLRTVDGYRLDKGDTAYVVASKIRVIGEDGKPTFKWKANPSDRKKIFGDPGHAERTIQKDVGGIFPVSEMSLTEHPPAPEPELTPVQVHARKMQAVRDAYDPAKGGHGDVPRFVEEISELLKEMPKEPEPAALPKPDLAPKPAEAVAAPTPAPVVEKPAPTPAPAPAQSQAPAFPPRDLSALPQAVPEGRRVALVNKDDPRDVRFLTDGQLKRSLGLTDAVNLLVGKSDPNKWTIGTIESRPGAKAMMSTFKPIEGEVAPVGVSGCPTLDEAALRDRIAAAKPGTAEYFEAAWELARRIKARPEVKAVRLDYETSVMTPAELLRELPRAIRNADSQRIDELSYALWAQDDDLTEAKTILSNENNSYITAKNFNSNNLMDNDIYKINKDNALHKKPENENISENKKHKFKIGHSTILIICALVSYASFIAISYVFSIRDSMPGPHYIRMPIVAIPIYYLLGRNLFYIIVTALVSIFIGIFTYTTLRGDD
ncbi:hypothetical protein CCP1ISM_110023 [Azospirillaceae bacterium]